MKGKCGTADAGLGEGVGVVLLGYGSRERMGKRRREGGRGTVSRRGIQKMPADVWCGPVTPQDITAVNRKR